MGAFCGDERKNVRHMRINAKDSKGFKSDQPITLIAGPTASGKSALAMEMAGKTGGVIVNADSMQIYRELRVLTARPTIVDEAAMPHRLYGLRPASEAYSVADWLNDVAPIVEQARSSGPPAIIVGGTGLYFKALLEGLSPVPDIPKEIRAYWREQANIQGAAALHEMLRLRDPEMAGKLAPSDSQRLVRALEVLDATGRSLGEWRKAPGQALVSADKAELIYVSPPREVLYARCDARLDAMIEKGALDEVRMLMTLELDDDLPLMRAVGVRSLRDFLAGSLSLEAALEAVKTDTRRYAKRQITWARRHMISWNWLFTQ